MPRGPAADESDAGQQADELCALQAIYGEEAVRVLEAGQGAAAYAFSVPNARAQPRLEVRAHLPASYPSQHPPIVELECGLLPPDVLAGLAAELEAMFVPGGDGATAVPSGARLSTAGAGIPDGWLRQWTVARMMCSCPLDLPPMHDTGKRPSSLLTPLLALQARWFCGPGWSTCASAGQTWRRSSRRAGGGKSPLREAKPTLPWRQSCRQQSS